MNWGNGNNQGPWGKIPNQPPPDIDKALKKGQEKFKKIFDGGDGGDNKKVFGLIAVFIFFIWLASGFFVIDAKEQGVILRFGAFNRTVSPGLNYRLPYPFEYHVKVPVTVVNQMHIGDRQGSRSRSGRNVAEESLMLTGDKNIVDANFQVQWRINDAKNFLFNVRDVESTVKSAAESAMREVIGRTQIDSALAGGKLNIEQDTKKLLQKILDSYKSGIEIVELQLGRVDPPQQAIDAYRDIQTAEQDAETSINQAISYKNDIIPRARGQAEQRLQEAEAYKQKVIAHSEGEAERFLSVYDKYRVAKDVTKRRIYLETMEEILNGMDKIMIDTRAQGSGVLPYLPLPALDKKNKGQ